MKIYVGGYILSTLTPAMNVDNYFKELSKLDGVIITHAIFGPDSVISHVQTETIDQYQNHILNKFRLFIEKKWISSFTPNLVIMDESLSLPSIHNDVKDSSMSAWILIKTYKESSEDVAKLIRNMKHVMSSHLVTGKYDIFTYIRCESKEELVNFIDRVLPSIPSIHSFDTRVVISRYVFNIGDRVIGARRLGLSNSYSNYEYY